MWGLICVVYKVQFMVIFISLLWNFVPYIQLAPKQVLLKYATDKGKTFPVLSTFVEMAVNSLRNNTEHYNCWFMQNKEEIQFRKLHSGVYLYYSRRILEQGSWYSFHIEHSKYLKHFLSYVRLQIRHLQYSDIFGCQSFGNLAQILFKAYFWPQCH